MGALESIGIKEGQGKYYEEAVYSLALIYNIITDEVSGYLNSHGLTPGKFNILMTVKHQGGDKGISQVEVSKRLIVTASNMTKLIDKLEKEALMTRSALPGDRRVKILKVTDKGSKLLDKVWPEYDARLKKMASSIDVQDQRSLAGLLLKWLDRMKG